MLNRFDALASNDCRSKVKNCADSTVAAGQSSGTLAPSSRPPLLVANGPRTTAGASPMAPRRSTAGGNNPNASPSHRLASDPGAVFSENRIVCPGATVPTSRADGACAPGRYSSCELASTLDGRPGVSPPVGGPPYRLVPSTRALDPDSSTS